MVSRVDRVYNRVITGDGPGLVKGTRMNDLYPHLMKVAQEAYDRGENVIVSDNGIMRRELRGHGTNELLTLLQDCATYRHLDRLNGANGTATLTGMIQGYVRREILDRTKR